MKDHRISPHTSVCETMETSFADGPPDENETTCRTNHADKKLSVTRTHSIDETKRKKWKIRCAFSPWRYFASASNESLYRQFKQTTCRHVTILPALAGFIFSICSFGLYVSHFGDEKMPSILLACVFLLIFVAFISLKISNEISLGDDPVIAVSSVIIFSLNISLSVFITDDVTLTSEKNIDWIILLLFLTYVAVPLSFWRCTAVALFVIFVHAGSTLLIQTDLQQLVSQEGYSEVATLLVFYATAVLVGSLTYMFLDNFVRRTFIDTENSYITQAKMKKIQEYQDKILQSVLPQSVRDSTAVYKGASTEEFYRRTCRNSSCASILFARISGMEALCKKEIKQFTIFMNDICENFDLLCKKFNAYPIRYIGGMFKAVVGAPETSNSHAVLSVYLGVAVQDCLRDMRKKHDIQDLDVSIGIHSGHVESGIMGKEQWHFDVFGVDVDIAREVQRIAPPGKVFISESTRGELRDQFIVDAAGMGDSQLLVDMGIKAYSIRYVIQQFQQFDEITTIAFRRRRRRGNTSVILESLTGSAFGTMSRQSNKEEDVDKLCFNSSLEKAFRKHQCQHAYLGAMSLIIVGLCEIGIILITKHLSHQELFLYLSGFTFLLLTPFVLLISDKFNTAGSDTALVIFRSIFTAVIVVTALSLFALANFLSLRECESQPHVNNASNGSSLVQFSVCNDVVYLSNVNICAMIGLVSFITVDHMTTNGALIGLLTFQLVTITYVFRSLFFDHLTFSSASVPPLYRLSVHAVGITLVLLVLERKVEFLRRRLFTMSFDTLGIDDQMSERKSKYAELQRKLFPGVILDQIPLFSFDSLGVPRVYTKHALVFVLRLSTNQNQDTDQTGYDAISEAINLIDSMKQSEEFTSVMKVATLDSTYVALATSLFGKSPRNEELACILDFVMHICDVIRDHHVNLTFTGGMHLGPVIYGLTSKNNPQFNVWGEAFDVAEELQRTSSPGGVQVTAEVERFFRDTKNCFKEISLSDRVHGEIKPTYSLTSTKEATELQQNSLES